MKTNLIGKLAVGDITLLSMTKETNISFKEKISRAQGQPKKRIWYATTNRQAQLKKLRKLVICFVIGSEIHLTL